MKTLLGLVLGMLLVCCGVQATEPCVTNVTVCVASSANVYVNPLDMTLYHITNSSGCLTGGYSLVTTDGTCEGGDLIGPEFCISWKNHENGCKTNASTAASIVYECAAVCGGGIHTINVQIPANCWGFCFYIVSSGAGNCSLSICPSTVYACPGGGGGGGCMIEPKYKIESYPSFLIASN